MDNTFANVLHNLSEMSKTENGATKYVTTGQKVYDLFALGGAYRERDTKDKCKLFSDAYNEDAELAIKCLYYLRDIRGGQGERQFFRDCILDLFNRGNLSNSQIEYLLSLIPEYGRWDDVIYLYNKVNYNIKELIIDIIKEQLSSDTIVEYPSLLAKWMPSENASSKESKFLARSLAQSLGISYKNYRKILSNLRKKINIVESLMSNNDWDNIEFDKIPSKAGFKYRNAFATRKETAERYHEFMCSEKTEVHSDTLYPYEISKKCMGWKELSKDERNVLQKYWINLPDYCTGKPESAICVVDVSGSMSGRPIEVSTSLGIYCAERLNGPFKHLIITFSKDPKIHEIKGIDIYEKVQNVMHTEWGMNTDLVKVFDLLYQIATKEGVNKEDTPKNIIIISDMEIDCATNPHYRWNYQVDKTEIVSTMESVREKWKNAGLIMPHLVYWNVNARNDTILDRGDNITCVSGFSPVLFESVLSGKTGVGFMLDKLNSPRYDAVHL